MRSTLQIAILDKPLPNVDIPDQRSEHSDPNDGSNKGDAHEYPEVDARSHVAALLSMLAVTVNDC